ncbi:MAG: cytosine permease [Salinibacterium sp.]|nr:cytosine permease [Salinibacterium sp.]
MADHDDPVEDDRDLDEAGAASGGPVGPRRSTWTPPPSRGTSDAMTMSDDDLANALAEDLDRVTHFGSSQSAGEGEPEPVDAEPVEPEPADPEPAEPVSIVPDAVDPETMQSEPEEPATVEPATDVPDLEDADSGATEPTSPPVRRSMPMNELAAALAEQATKPGSSDDIIARLEEQLRLREQDAAEFASWQESMLATGAIDEVESARSEFGDLFPAPKEPESKTGRSGAQESEATHTFRMDEVLDSDLKSAPAPMSPPLRDIPPPPGHELMPPRRDMIPPIPESPPEPGEESVEANTAGVAEEITEVDSAQIPELVEPGPPPVPDAIDFDFDSLLSGAVPDADSEPTVFVAEPHDGTYAPDSGDVESVRDDDVADTDQAFADLSGPFPVTSEGVAMLPDTPAAPVEPVPSRSVASAAATAITETGILEGPSAFRVEAISVEPTPEDQRVGRAARLFWLWFAANSSVVSVAFGGAVFALGMSLRQAIVATLIGVAISFLPLGLGTLAGKWSGQPTMIVSRATFGHLGNILPAVFALVVRVFWGAVLLWFLAAGTARILAGAELTGPLAEPQVTIIGLAIGFLLALVIAYFGYGLIARMQLVVTIITAILIVGLIVITWPAVNIQTALTVGDGPWILVVTGAVLVFSFVGLVWAVSSADLARYQRPDSSGTTSMLWSTFGATIPAFALISYGAVLAASNPDVAKGLVETPLDTIALLIPVWYPIPLIVALAASLLSGVVISIYSAGFALQGTGATMRRSAAVVVSGGAVAVVAIAIAVSVGDFDLILRDLATSLAVPMAAWAGIFGAEMMIRNRGFNAEALLKRGGIYPDVNWVNLGMLVVCTVVGFGLTTATVGWLSWQGYLFPLLNVPLGSDLAASDLGVFVALILGLLTPIVAGIPGIRRQEQVFRSN